ncbi:MAG: SLC13 family permease [Anaerolineales bacterium]|nr:SLC13 family permease [Anaerolineales bacterium]NUQ86451.1 SLC13 family permease [Anaerolineales bacterium]
MTIEQWIIFGTLALTLILFITGRWRYDVVALIALLVAALTGLVPAERVFSGFSNSAVVTVAAVLVLSRGLQNSGVVDMIGGWLANLKGGITIQLAALTVIVAVLSAFMNNVGALALLLPVVLQLARKKQMPASALLMPLAFASLLGGMTTLIGTPPNIIAASFREAAGGEPFRMFDFTPVGGGVLIAGLLFIVLVGWRLIPKRSGGASESLFDIENYVTEVRISEKSKLNGKRLYEIGEFSKADVLVIGLVRGGERRMEPGAQTKLLADDILIVNADTENIQKLAGVVGVELVGNEKIGRDDLASDDVALIEAVIMPNSVMYGGTARSLDLRARYGVNLLAISRQGKLLKGRLDGIRFQTGDVLLLQSHVQTLKKVAETLGCLPLAGRDLRLRQPRQMILALGIFISALAFAALGILPVQVSFVAAVVLMIVAKLVTLQEAYDSVDWPIIILLGAMIPVGGALETTGGAQLIANSILHISNQMSPTVSLIILLVATMFLSDLVNNAAAVVLMAPIGINVAQGLGVSIDPFLMALTIGASCAFLTPIGHQSNTLVMGPGGYKFSDYWRMGLILEVIVAVVAIPLILLFWPL